MEDVYIPQRPSTSKRSMSLSNPQFSKTKLGADQKPLLSAYKKTLKIWESLQLSNYKKEGLLKRLAIDVFYESEKQNLDELLKIKSSDELVLLIDEDEDGCFNEDEQILIFSIIKERMKQCADSLCENKEYKLYEHMVACIKKLEDDIVKYQKLLREQVNKNDLNCVFSFENSKIHEFEGVWKQKFEVLSNQKAIHLNQISKKHKNEIKEFLTADEIKNCFRIKPELSLKLLKTREKLMAVDENFLEAAKLKEDVKKREKNEKMRGLLIQFITQTQYSLSYH